ncbi:TRAP transporter permease [Chloroflexota bacterium]
MKIGKYQITKNSIILFLGAFIILFNMYRHAWLPLDAYIERGTFLTVFILLAVLINPPKSSIAKIVLAVFTVMALIGSIYPILFSERLTSQFHYARETDIYVFFIFIIGLVGVLSRVGGGFVVTGLMLLSIIYLFLGNYIPGLFGHMPMTLEFITSLLYTDVGQGVFGAFTDVFVRIVSIFIIFAAFLFAIGLGDLFTAIACRIAGNATGGPAKVSVLSSGAFGMISGSAVANVIATGSFTIPTMKSVGYKPKMAATVEAIASTGGMLMPPIMGSMAFLMADILSISYLRICLAAIIPVFLWYYTAYVIVHYYALRTGIEKWRPSMDEVKAVIREKFHFAFAILALFGALFYFASAEQAALAAVIFLFGLSFIRKGTRLNKEKLTTFLQTYVQMFTPIFILIAGLAVFVAALTGSGAHLKLGSVILGGVEQWYMVLFLTFVLTLVLGMGVTPVGTYLAAAAIAVPILGGLGFNTLAVHMFIFYAAILGPITPPVCLASYNAARIAGTNLMKTGLYASYVSIPLWIFPFVIVSRGLILGIGTPAHVLLIEVAVLCIGVLLFVVGTQGYFRRRLNFLERTMATLIGIMTVQPISDYYSKIFCVIGLALLIFWYLSHFVSTRKSKVILSQE